MILGIFRAMAAVGIGLAMGDSPQGGAAGSVEDRYGALSADYRAKAAANRRAGEAAEAGGVEDLRRFAEAATAEKAEYAKRFLALAREEPRGPSPRTR